MGFMKPSTPSVSSEQTIPVKAESVQAEVEEDYRNRERRRQGMASTMLSRRQAESDSAATPQTLLRKTLG